MLSNETLREETLARIVGQPGIDALGRRLAVGQLDGTQQAKERAAEVYKQVKAAR